MLERQRRLHDIQCLFDFRFAFPFAFLIAFLIVLPFALWPSVAWAGTIQVDGTICTIPEAVAVANNDDDVGSDCTLDGGAPDAADTLFLEGALHTLDGTVLLDHLGPTAVPAILGDIIIVGDSGTGGTTVQRVAASSFRLFFVVGSLTISDVTIIDFDAEAGNGGGIYNIGALTLTNSSLISNNAVRGGGIYSTNNSTSILSNSDILSNTATLNGGGIYNHSGSHVTVTTSSLLSNTASIDGGGIYNTLNSFATISNTHLISNSAGGNGGGIHNFDNATATVTTSSLLSNTAVVDGGAIYNQRDSFLLLSNSQIIANRAGRDGGGVYNHERSILPLSNSQLIANRAGRSGGGVYIIFNTHFTISNSQIIANSAVVDGGGIFNENGSTLTVTTSSLLSNSAGDEGGGLYNNFSSSATLTGTNILSNTAEFGGGIFNRFSSDLDIDNSRILSNTGLSAGGAFYQRLGTPSTRINESCIVNNSDTAVFNDATPGVDAKANWWGAANGPSGVGPGSGDSISSNVDSSDFKLSAILGCPDRLADLTLEKSIEPLGNLLPGQPVTFTIVVTNNRDVPVAHEIFVNDTLPSQFLLTEFSSSGATIVEELGGFRIEPLPALAVARIQLRGTVDGTLNADAILSNNAFISQSVLGNSSEVVTAAIVVPRVSFNATTFHANEGDGNVLVTLVLNSVNPYAEVEAEVLSTDSLNSLSALNGAENEVGIAAVQTVNLAAGSLSQSLVLPFADDEGVAARSIALALQNSVGAALGGNSSATVIINENDQAGLTVLKTANVTQASAGDTIIYTYEIANTGNVALTIVANDDRLGAVSGLAGNLAPLATRTATLPYTVLASDPVGPLVNTVTVTGTNGAASVVVTDTFTITIGASTQRIENYLPSVENKAEN